MYEVKFLLLAVFSISLLACSQSQVSEQEALAIAYGWADERGVFEPVDKWMPILREADVFSNDNYFVVMFKYDVPPGFDAADHGLHVVIDRNNGLLVYVGGPSAIVFDEHFPRDASFVPYYEGIVTR